MKGKANVIEDEDIPSRRKSSSFGLGEERTVCIDSDQDKDTDRAMRKLDMFEVAVGMKEMQLDHYM